MSLFPDPIGWAIDQVGGFVTSTATAGFELVVGGLTAWVVDAVVWTVGAVFGFFLDASDPNVQADWFVTGDGPYATTVGIGASLLVLFLLAGIVQGIIDGDVAGMVRRISLDLPVSILGMVALVTVTQSLIALTDALSREVMGHFIDDIEQLVEVVESLTTLQGGTSTAFVVFLLGLVTVIAGLVLVAELVIRSALIYIVVALAPMVFAARVWPATRGASRKLLELLAALIVSKLVIAIALSVAAAAAVGSGSGGEVTSLPEPEVFAEDPGGSVTQAVGILLTSAAAFGVAAFSPMLVVRLLPATEAAAVAHGVKGGPVRAAHQTLLIGNAARGLSGRRLSQLTSGQPSAGAGAPPPGAAPGGGANGATGAAGGGAGGAAASGAGAAGAAGAAATVAASMGRKGASNVRTGARAATATAEGAADARPPSQSARPAKAPARPPGSAGGGGGDA